MNKTLSKTQMMRKHMQRNPDVYKNDLLREITNSSTIIP